MNSPSLVFFDFKESDSFWFLLPNISNTEAFLGQMNRKVFIDCHLKGEFDEFDLFLKKKVVNPLKNDIRRRKRAENRRNVLSNSYLRRTNRRL